MPMDPYAALQALLRAEAVRATPAASEAEHPARQAPPTSPAAPEHDDETAAKEA
ncbi:hypothetical protein [Streptomyces sp. KL118A]|uniref:hypothetical protein n=1 Tax=Streptomyces sp. KL118A TaxID=3045153 RepID=UPI00278C7134|nr:hypothetical protein [Streptomyces sp. KL118A]